jgi:hypothetical protein
MNGIATSRLSAMADCNIADPVYYFRKRPFIVPSKES